jgi:hypothetical protein
MHSTTRRLATRRFAMAAACLITLILTAQTTLPKTVVWTNASPIDDLWTNSGNWMSTPPTSSDIVVFGTTTGTSTMDIAGLNLAELDMSGFSGALGLLYPLGIDGNLHVSGLLTLLGNSLDVGGNITVDDYLEAPGTTVTVGGHLTLGPSATLDMEDGTLKVGGDLDLASGTALWVSGGTLRFQGTGLQIWSVGLSSVVYANVEVANSGGIVNMQSVPGPSVEVDELTISRGLLQLNVGGLWVHGATDIGSDGEFLNGDPDTYMEFDSTVVVNGLFASHQSGCILRFAPGTPGKVDVGGTATFEVFGTPGDRTFLQQDGMAGGSQWILEHDPGAMLLFEDIVVQDSDAQPDPVSAGGTSVNGGNTTNWYFPIKETMWTGAGPTNNWSDFLNWDNGVPGKGDSVFYDAVGGLSVMDIDTLTLRGMEMTGFFGTLTVLRDMAFTSSLKTDGMTDLNAHTVGVMGNLLVRGTLDATNATLEVGEGGGDLMVLDTLDAPGAGIHVAGSLGGAGGSLLDITAAFVDLKGDLNADSLELVAGGSAVFFSGIGIQSWKANPSSSDYYNVNVTGGGGGGHVVLNAPGELISVHNLLVSGGTLEMAGGDLEVNGEMTVSSGASFENNTNAHAGFVFLGGISVDGGTFRSTAAGCGLYFTAGAPGTVDVNSGATFEVSGVPYDRTRLYQDGMMGGTQWILAYGTIDTLVFADVEVQDSYAQPGPVTATGESTDMGNNTNWNFPQKETIWMGGGGTDNWSDVDNWDNGLPAANDDVYFWPAGGLSVMDIEGLGLHLMDMTGFTGELTLLYPLSVTSGLTVDGAMETAGYQLFVVGNLAVDGTLNADSTQLMVLGGDLDVAGTFDGLGARTTVSGSATISGSLQTTSATLNVGGNVDVLGPCIVTDSDVDIGGSLGGGSGGTFDMTGATVDLDGNLNASGGLTLVSGGGGSGGTLNFTGGDQSWTAGPSSADYAHVRVSGNSLVLNAPGTLIRIADLQVIGGTLEITGGDLQVTGNTSMPHGGTFENNTNAGAVLRFDGGLSVGTLSSTADGCTLSVASGATVNGTLDVEGDGSELRFSAGDTVTVNSSGTFRVIGGSLGDRAKLRLDGDPYSGQWHLNVQSGATTQFENIEVQDSDASPGESCTANGECIDLGNNDNWNFVGTAVGDVPPPRLSLRAAPNPFNPSTNLHYGVPSAGKVTIRVYGVRGELVRTILSARREPGVYMESWDGRDDDGTAVATGLYLCRIESNGASVVKKLVLLK